MTAHFEDSCCLFREEGGGVFERTCLMLNPDTDDIVLDRRALNQLVKTYCVPLILDGDAKRHKVYTGLGNGCPTSSLRDRSCIPCIEMLVVGGYK